MIQKNTCWTFSAKAKGLYEHDEWDMQSLLTHHRYYLFKEEKNREYVRPGDRIYFRTFGQGWWGRALVESPWMDDPRGMEKYGKESGWFQISQLENWHLVLPQEIVLPELSRKIQKDRIASLREDDQQTLEQLYRLYKVIQHSQKERLFYLHQGLEKLIPMNLTQLNLELADPEIIRQCKIDMAFTERDFLCRDSQKNFVLVKLKHREHADALIGQMIRFMGYIRENWVRQEQVKLRSIILVSDPDEKLKIAARESQIEIRQISLATQEQNDEIE